MNSIFTHAESSVTTVPSTSILQTLRGPVLASDVQVGDYISLGIIPWSEIVGVVQEA